MAAMRHGPVCAVTWHRKVKICVQWNYDRQQFEQVRYLYDRENDHYIQEWTALDTGEPTFCKEGKLSDRKMHGKSARRGRT